MIPELHPRDLPLNSELRAALALAEADFLSETPAEYAFDRAAFEAEFLWEETAQLRVANLWLFQMLKNPERVTDLVEAAKMALPRLAEAMPPFTPPGGSLMRHHIYEALAAAVAAMEEPA